MPMLCYIIFSMNRNNILIITLLEVYHCLTTSSLVLGHYNDYTHTLPHYVLILLHWRVGLAYTCVV